MFFVGFINPLEANYLLNKHMVKASAFHSEPPLKTDLFYASLNIHLKSLRRKQKFWMPLIRKKTQNEALRRYKQGSFFMADSDPFSGWTSFLFQGGQGSPTLVH